jgi:hypothetical protein
MAGAGNRDSCRETFKPLKILTLTSQFINSLVMFLVNKMELFVENSEMYITKTINSSHLLLPSSTLTVFQKGSQYFGIKVNNGLPDNIKHESRSKNQFKKALLLFLHLHSFYNRDQFFKFRGANFCK